MGIREPKLNEKKMNINGWTLMVDENFLSDGLIKTAECLTEACDSEIAFFIIDDGRAGAVVIMHDNFWKVIPAEEVVLENDRLGMGCALGGRAAILESCEVGKVYGILHP